MAVYLSYDISVGEADHYPVLGCVILGLVLNNQTFSSTIISLALYNRSQPMIME